MGIEGLLSTVFATAATLIAAALPGMDTNHRLENLPDTLAQLRNSPHLVGICVAFVASVAGGNLFGLRVSGACRRTSPQCTYDPPWDAHATPQVAITSRRRRQCARLATNNPLRRLSHSDTTYHLQGGNDKHAAVQCT